MKVKVIIGCVAFCATCMKASVLAGRNKSSRLMWNPVSVAATVKLSRPVKPVPGVYV